MLAVKDQFGVSHDNTIRLTRSDQQAKNDKNSFGGCSLKLWSCHSSVRVESPKFETTI